MNNYIFSGSLFIPLSQSLSQYFNSILNEKLRLLQSNVVFDETDIDFVFVINEPSEINCCCRWIYENNISPDKLRILGYDKTNDINLLEFDTLKFQFEKSFEVEKGIDLTNISFFRDKINMFFKGHGEQSLLQSISYVAYNLSNYSSLVETGDYTQEGLYRNFLLPGIQNWNEFVHRFNKYAPVLYVRGWTNETNTINNLIKIISIGLEKVDASKPFIIFELESMSLINEIVFLLEGLAQQQQD